MAVKIIPAIEMKVGDVFILNGFYCVVQKIELHPASLVIDITYKNRDKDCLFSGIMSVPGNLHMRVEYQLIPLPAFYAVYDLENNAFVHFNNYSERDCYDWIHGRLQVEYKDETDSFSTNSARYKIQLFKGSSYEVLDDRIRMDFISQ